MRIDNKLIWEAYTTVHNESPDKVRDPNYSSDIMFFWNCKADFTSTFMRIGDQWFLSGINVFTPDTKFYGTAKTKVHADMFNKLITTELQKNFPKYTKGVDYRSLNDHEKISLIIRMIKANKILSPIYNQYEIHGCGELFLNEIEKVFSSAADKTLVAYRKEKGFEELVIHTIFYVPDDSETRVWFDCGRLWLNPQHMDGSPIPGIVISMWKLPTGERRSKIENELSSILQKNNIRFSRIVWDGDKDIDPKTKHIKASKAQIKTQASWDDIKYAN